jgi:hypothetical protein
VSPLAPLSGGNRRGLWRECTQFITSFHGQTLASEKLLRLKNDFPTTRREQLEFAEKVAANAAVLTGEAERLLLGKSSGNGGLTLADSDLGELEVLKARQLAAAAAAQVSVYISPRHISPPRFSTKRGKGSGIHVDT